MDNKWRIIIICIAAAAVLGAGVLYYAGRAQDDSVLVVSAQSPSPAPSDEADAEHDDDASQTMMVHVVGEVKNPGVYELPAGSRIINAVEMAGGLTDEAGQDVNLAKLLTDGEQVVISKPRQPETAANYVSADTVETANENLLAVNINTATKSELMKLPGVGETIADSIIRYREANGGFKSKDAIKDVPRIGEKNYLELEDLITVE